VRISLRSLSRCNMRGMKTAPTTLISDLSPLDLRQQINVKAAAALNDLSEASFRRHYSHLIRKVTPRRDAVELGDALALPPAKEVQPSNSTDERGEPTPPRYLFLIGNLGRGTSGPRFGRPRVVRTPSI
jgi:hypothetical protein